MRTNAPLAGEKIFDIQPAMTGRTVKAYAHLAFYEKRRNPVTVADCAVLFEDDLKMKTAWLSYTAKILFRRTHEFNYTAMLLQGKFPTVRRETPQKKSLGRGPDGTNILDVTITTFSKDTLILMTSAPSDDLKAALDSTFLPRRVLLL
ncbi:MAG: hypothetical protein MK165_11880 [Pirellulaceae bacterium]|nr:hypothetical protein [Pirellulaceae bacterium]